MRTHFNLNRFRLKFLLASKRQKKSEIAGVVAFRSHRLWAKEISSYPHTEIFSLVFFYLPPATSPSSSLTPTCSQIWPQLKFPHIYLKFLPTHPPSCRALRPLRLQLQPGTICLLPEISTNLSAIGNPADNKIWVTRGASATDHWLGLWYYRDGRDSRFADAGGIAERVAFCRYNWIRDVCTGFRNHVTRHVLQSIMCRYLRKRGRWEHSV